jgi:hypothetical protein
LLPSHAAPGVRRPDAGFAAGSRQCPAAQTGQAFLLSRLIRVMIVREGWDQYQAIKTRQARSPCAALAAGDDNHVIH